MSGAIRIYCAAPLHGSGSVDTNVKRALAMGEAVMEAGMIPFVPHLFMFWHFRHEHPAEYWLAMDKAWLLQCHFMVRLAGDSPGATLEEGWADEAGIKWVEATSVGHLRPLLPVIRGQLTEGAE